MRIFFLMILAVKQKNAISSLALCSILCLVTALFFSSCSKNQEPADFVVFTGATMGTTYAIKVSDFPDTLAKKQVQQDIEKLLERINRSMSTYLPDSEISSFNRFNSSSLFPVSPLFFQVVQESLRISSLTDGALDITVAPLVNLWGFGPVRQLKPVVPDEEKIKALKKRIGYKKIKVKVDPPAIGKANPELTIDLSSVAKGFAVDQVGMLLESTGLTHYLVEIGGEIRAGGQKAHQSPWIVGIERPADHERTIQRVISMENNSMATSGDYRNYFEKDNHRFSHLIDPNTGRPVDHRLASVSVIHKSCMTADAFATAFMIMGSEKGYQLALRENLAAYFLDRTQSGFEMKMTPAFETLIVKN